MAEANLTFAPLPSNPRFKNLKDREFGRLTVLGFAGRSPVGRKGRMECRWWCKCNCGTIKSITANCLTTGHTESCGCLYRGAIAARTTTHGHSPRGGFSPEYQTWANMIGRCFNENTKQYKDYGGRGVTVCQRWRDSFETFLEDMGSKPSPKHTIKRNDNNGNYEPGNCRWATRLEQNRNKRSNRMITINGETRCLSEWCQLRGLSYSAALARIDKGGWTPEDALSTPVRKMKKWRQVGDSL